MRTLRHLRRIRGTMLVVVAVEEAAFLHAVERDVGVVEIDHDLERRPLMGLTSNASTFAPSQSISLAACLPTPRSPIAAPVPICPPAATHRDRQGPRGLARRQKYAAKLGDFGDDAGALRRGRMIPTGTAS